MKYAMIQNLISTIADAQHLAAPQDKLSMLVLRYAPKTDDELDADELQFVSAARSHSYDEFIKRIGNQNIGKQGDR